ncbi:hypothetical protein HNP38_002344 [Chryseobacterium defluvii]|uniref:Tetratricopeptide repeat protein n=1 Tax=Chryseobacterium defluvii TaxID=160396 RepID=A0A840KHR5_9FLAO|nr:hypothetical protein [Chryseobacterium defluvii]MBB4807040.1 hypothetical protein [Chryseobacterium defluvii]
MNPRVLELLKDPKNIRSEDMTLLQEEISSFPYIQNIRALHLYGVHLYDRDNYQKELSVTAAYTTDKKILYQLINGKIQQKPKPEIIVEKKEEIVEPIQETEALQNKIEEKTEIKPESEKTQVEDSACLLAQPHPEVNHVYINGERNRILFEGEENFLEDEHQETIDLESTLESGIIVTQRSESVKQPELVSEEKELKDAEDIASFTPEVIIEEEKTSSEKDKDEVINDDLELSFHETAEFLPEVNIQAGVGEIKSIAENPDKSERVADFTPETIINEEEISSEKEKKSVRDDHELSFHGLDSFLPEVTIQSSNSGEETKTEAPKSNVNKHEEEMRRLIEEVEKKMKAKKEASPEKKEEEPEIHSHDINFAETQAFHAASSENKEEKGEQTRLKEELELENPSEIITKEESEPLVEIREEVKSSWKPMSLESHIPDSLINKPTEITQPKADIMPETQDQALPSIEELSEPIEDRSEELEAEDLKAGQEVSKIDEMQKKQQEVPIMNVSFFNSGWTINEPKEEIKETPAEEAAVSLTTEESNVPGFINTWQSWLKIDRTQETEKTKVESKAKTIDSFIENNPKISQLKEESSYVVKEKTGDISHLMTETLANLYFEQKLYTKAMNAFQILADKHPDKKAYFEAKIQEIKDIRGKN